MEGPRLSSKEMLDSDEEDSSYKDTLFRGKVTVRLGSSYLTSTLAIDSVESIRIKQFGKPKQKESASDLLLKQSSISEKSDGRDELKPPAYKTIAPTPYKKLTDVLSPIATAELKQRRFSTTSTPQSQKRRRRESIVIDLSKSDTETEVEEEQEDDDDDDTEVEIIEDEDDDTEVEIIEDEVVVVDDDDMRRYSTKKRYRRSR